MAVEGGWDENSSGHRDGAGPVAGRRRNRVIPLRAADGTPYSGRRNSQARTGETIVDRDGDPLPPDPNGYDSEGLVAMPDGTFWVSDEYFSATQTTRVLNLLARLP